MRILLPGFPFAGIHQHYLVYLRSALDALGHEHRLVMNTALTDEVYDEFKPDVILTIHGRWVPFDRIAAAQKRGIATVLWSIEEPYELDFLLQPGIACYDLLYTNDRLSAEYLAGAAGRPDARYLPWCCSRQHHVTPASIPPRLRSDVCLVGVGFGRRIELLNAIAPVLSRLDCKLVGLGDGHPLNRSRLRLDPRLRRFQRQAVLDHRLLPYLYAGAKINLNIHRDPLVEAIGNSRRVAASSPNDRTFAIAGCGGFQLVDASRPDLGDLFLIGRELDTFADAGELAKKIHHYLRLPDRPAMAAAGQARAHAEHTFEHRLQVILADVQTLGRGSANASPPTPREV